MSPSLPIHLSRVYIIHVLKLTLSSLQSLFSKCLFAHQINVSGVYFLLYVSYLTVSSFSCLYCPCIDITGVPAVLFLSCLLARSSALFPCAFVVRRLMLQTFLPCPFSRQCLLDHYLPCLQSLKLLVLGLQFSQHPNFFSSAVLAFSFYSAIP